jgi:DNA repair protein RadA/Sms
VLYLEGERGQEFRILRAAKNRFGSTEEIGIFAMGEEGMSEVRDPSAVLLGDHHAVPGTAVLATMEGSRPILVEVQGLAASMQFGLPRRSANGIELSRLHMIVAVLEKRAGIALGQVDVYVNVAGGLRVQEPAADLATALAIASSLRDRPLPAETVVIGELGLAGEVRRVGRMERRLQEASRRGFVRAIVPRGSAGAAPAGVRLIEVGELAEAVQTLLPGDSPREAARAAG